MSRQNIYKCGGCGWVGTPKEMLTGKHPFDDEETVSGCPECKDIEPFKKMCDVRGCKTEASCGWPSDDGYRMTCYNHKKGGE